MNRIINYKIEEYGSDSLLENIKQLKQMIPTQKTNKN